ncbi:Protein CBG24673 [Caenorhabditis briggsae]|uniref:Protein CBG24673 n=1 Tax=Caenorhabditis briggsae TaxID=6238 RepID=Q155W6_CAEBR|nr:Protein CBG24673 [Caenorhabditis briggsae]ABG29107.1 sex determining protein MOG-3 [Caenorhabditis briggsae]CAP21225.2 Protein CBG24673 [Caenorhabditis briggsae]
MSKDASINWMYEGAKGNVHREDYLLGKKVDKNFEKYSDVVNAQKADAIDSIVSTRTVFNTGQSTGLKTSFLQKDIIKSEDPFVAVRVREETKRRELMDNPLMKARLQNMLKSMMTSKSGKKKDKKSKKDKSKKKHKKRSRSSSSSSSEDDAQRSRKERKVSPSPKRKRKTSERSEETKTVGRKDSNDDQRKRSRSNERRRRDRRESPSPIRKRSRSRSLRMNRSSRSNRASSRSVERNRKMSRSPRRNRSRSRSPLKTRKASRSPRRNRSRSRSAERARKHSPKRQRSRSADTRHRSSQRSRDDRKERRKSDSRSESPAKQSSSNSKSSRQFDSHVPEHFQKNASGSQSESEHERRSRRRSEEDDSKKSYGLVEMRKRTSEEREIAAKGPSKEYKLIKIPTGRGTNNPSNKREPRRVLTDEEKAARLAEMKANVKWRDEVRTSNVAKGRVEDEEEKEEAEKNGYAPSFIRSQMRNACDDMTVEKRLQSNKKGVQRAPGYMDRSFARK